jgi:glycosyltransferase involved in cell wall biosynthesis
MIKIHAHILTRNEEHILPYSLRHYTGFCEKVFVHDMGSTDRTMDIASEFGATIRRWDTGGKFDDNLNTRIKNECWQGLGADWTMVVDADEIIYFPRGEQETLGAYDRQGLAVARPHGFEMLHETWPDPKGQIYDEAKCGAFHPDYCKPVLFWVPRIKSIRFSPGAHHLDELSAIDGTAPYSPGKFADPPVFLLHYHQIGSIEKIAARYDEHTKRMCEANIRNHWGNQEPGMKHAIEKRNLILSRLERVVP